MALALYDSLTRSKRDFIPADPKRVTAYVCGPTVYGHAHIGNFRAAVVFDLLFRILRRRYGDSAVVYARNVTDIDDKIIKAAREAGSSVPDITRKYADAYRAETSALNVLPPTLEPLATGHVDAMIALIGALLDKGFAYVAEGHVLFRVDKFEQYGRLSGADPEEMLAGARVEVAPYKENPADFVLWKPSKEGEPGWPAPAAWRIEGEGRPGWHLECSAMIERLFGATIDIHGGGQDLRFPHHENEIAQSVSAHDGAPLARYWLHNGFLRMGDEKMSKSLGNIVLPRDLLRKHHGETLRWALLSAHYRQPLDWTEALIDQSKRQLDRFYRLFLEAGPAPAGDAPDSIVLALEDDLNTPEAFAGLHALRDAAGQMEGSAKARAAASLRAAGELMGFFRMNPEDWLKGRAIHLPTVESTTTLHTPTIIDSDKTRLSESEIDARIAARAAARVRKDFAEADRIRDELAAQGIIIEDGPHGATWRRA